MKKQLASLMRPERAIKFIKTPIERFLKLESAGSLLLIFSSLLALLWANSSFSNHYFHLLYLPLSIQVGNFLLSMTLHQWVNDGLMVLFFFLVGLEIKRELMIGELASRQKAMLPLFAALGGMIFPAAIYMILNKSGPVQAGWGIPMATDIAFAVGILTMIKKKVPLSLKVLLLALAIVDDLGAVFVIAIFYTQKLSVPFMLWAALSLLFVILFRSIGIRHLSIYIALGILTWLTVLKSGIHATVAGVFLGFLTPFDPTDSEQEAIEKIKILTNEENKKTKNTLESIHFVTNNARSPLDRAIFILHPIITFFVMPIFALTNAGIHFDNADFSLLIKNPVALGIILGLTLGKPIGILIFSWIAIKMKWAKLPTNVNWSHMLGMGCIAGIGFTMALFISDLALKNSPAQTTSKLSIFIASIVSASLGFLFLTLIRDSKINGKKKDFHGKSLTET